MKNYQYVIAGIVLVIVLFSTWYFSTHETYSNNASDLEKDARLAYNLGSDSSKPVLLYFFATWCPYCHEDFNNLKKIYPEYKDKVDIIAYSLDLNENSEKIDNYSRENGYEWNLLPGTEELIVKYNARFTTKKFAFSKEGKVLYQGSGVLDEDNWRKLLDGMIEYEK